MRIIISLTTIPTRISKLKPTIDSIKKQSIKPDKIVLNIPKKFSRTGEKYIIPKWIVRDKKITINHCGEDKGPIMKLFPTIFLENDPESIIISIDDDNCYGKHMIEELCKYSSQYNNAAFGSSGLILTNDHQSMSHSVHLNNVTVLEGFGAVAYKRKFFDEDFSEYVNKVCENIQCKLSDDITISNYLASKNIERKTIRTDKYSLGHVIYLPYGFKNDALHKGANNLIEESCVAERYIPALKYLAEKKILAFESNERDKELVKKKARIRTSILRNVFGI